jgi:hypothetical protein
MTFQFSTSTMMLLTAFIAISLGGAMPLVRGMKPVDWEVAALGTAILSPLWVPVMFASYAIGRRAVTPKVVALFAAIEGTIVAAFCVWKS